MRFTPLRDRRRMEESALEPRAEIDVHCGGTVFLLRLFIFVESVHSLPLFCKKRNGFSSAVRTAPNVSAYSAFDLFFAVNFYDSGLYAAFMFLRKFTRKDYFAFCFCVAYRFNILALSAKVFAVFTVDFFHSFTLQYINYRKLR